MRHVHSPRTLRRLAAAAALIPLLSALAGCGSDSLADLERYAEAVNARPGPSLRPLCVELRCDALRPDFEPPVFGGRGPFDNPWRVAAAGPATPTPMPDPHPAEELEGHALDSLRMLGLVTHRGQRWALLRAPDGVVHRVRAGNYLGRNNGKVLAVEEHRVVLEEIVWSDARGWEDRAAELALGGG